MDTHGGRVTPLFSHESPNESRNVATFGRKPSLFLYNPNSLAVLDKKLTFEESANES
jgi:hypothetical protein